MTGKGGAGGVAAPDESLRQLEQLQERLEELKKTEEYAQLLQRQLQEQQRVNREQAEHIQRLTEVNRQLQQQNALLAQRCQEAGLSSTTTTSSVLDSMTTTSGGGGERPGSGGRQSNMMVGGFSNMPLHSFPGTPPYLPNPASSPPNRPLGPHIGGSGLHQHRSNMLHPPYGTLPRMGHRDLSGGASKAAGMPYVAVGDGAGHAYSMSDSSPMSNGSARGSNFAYPFGPCSVPPDGDCKLSGSRAFSPNPMTGVDPYLDSILNLTGLPTGSGAGYGVGVIDDELLPGPLQLTLRYVPML